MPRPFQQTMIIDAGRANGVKPGQAVVDPRGMIGRIFIAGAHTSWVIQLTDLNSHIPVTIEPGNVQAIMAGDNSSEPMIEVVSQNASLKDGDQVASSGDGSLLPPGLPIGTLHATGNGTFRVSLLADPASSLDVNILDYKRPIETPPTVQPSDLPAVAAGLKPAAPAPAAGTQQLLPLAPVPAPKPPQAAVTTPNATQFAQHAPGAAQPSQPNPSTAPDNSQPDDDTNQ